MSSSRRTCLRFPFRFRRWRRRRPRRCLRLRCRPCPRFPRDQPCPSFHFGGGAARASRASNGAGGTITVGTGGAARAARDSADGSGADGARVRARSIQPRRRCRRCPTCHLRQRCRRCRSHRRKPLARRRRSYLPRKRIRPYLRSFPNYSRRPGHRPEGQRSTSDTDYRRTFGLLCFVPSALSAWDRQRSEIDSPPLIVGRRANGLRKAVSEMKINSPRQVREARLRCVGWERCYP